MFRNNLLMLKNGKYAFYEIYSNVCIHSNMIMYTYNMNNK